LFFTNRLLWREDSIRGGVANGGVPYLPNPIVSLHSSAPVPDALSTNPIVHAADWPDAADDETPQVLAIRMWTSAQREGGVIVRIRSELPEDPRFGPASAIGPLPMSTDRWTRGVGRS
jgi:hypothetical protein